ncbi:hypothetical protein QBC45DRAFT_411400 [Copromyces sp. CBS 386.78]|nr:hypothetical protein QBC45DRAFT_411400 [Copromyces sp. CBS 386.78]
MLVILILETCRALRLFIFFSFVNVSTLISSILSFSQSGRWHRRAHCTCLIPMRLSLSYPSFRRLPIKFFCNGQSPSFPFSVTERFFFFFSNPNSQ